MHGSTNKYPRIYDATQESTANWAESADEWMSHHDMRLMTPSLQTCQSSSFTEIDFE